MPLASFLTGFFDEKARIISDRKDEGEEYFRTQSERARRIYSEQIGQRRERYQQLAVSGNTLMNTANMPEHVLRGLVRAGPEAVQTALQIFNELPQHEWTVTDWEDMYATSQFYAQEFNEDFNTFLKRTTGLLADNYRATEETGGDLQSAFMASALGYNAMDRARSRLQDYEVAPGVSAKDALAMESRPLHQSDMHTTYSGPVPEAFQGIAGRYSEEALSPDDIWKWRGRFEDAVDRKEEELREQAFSQGIDAPEGLRDAARQQVALMMARDLGPEFVSNLTFLHPYLPLPEEEALTGSQMPADGQEEVPAFTPVPTADGPSVAVPEPPRAGTPDGWVEDGRFPDQDSPLIPRPSWDPADLREEPVPGESGPGFFQRVLNSIFGRSQEVRGRMSPAQRGAVDPEMTPGGRGGNFGARPNVPSEIPGEGTPIHSPGASPVQRGALDPNFIPGGSQNVLPHTLNSQGQAVLPDGRLTVVKGIDPNTQAWVYEDLQTGEEIHIPLTQ